jgi:hypothetical protein
MSAVKWIAVVIPICVVGLLAYGGYRLFSPVETRDYNLNTLSNMKQIRLGIVMYENDHGDRFPNMSDVTILRQTLFKYIPCGVNIFEISRLHQPLGVNTSLSGLDASRIKNPEKTIEVYEVTPDRDGKRCVLFVSGDTDRIDSSAWDSLKVISDIHE